MLFIYTFRRTDKFLHIFGLLRFVTGNAIGKSSVNVEGNGCKTRVKGALEIRHNGNTDPGFNHGAAYSGRIAVIQHRSGRHCTQAGLQSGHLNRTFRRFQKDHGFALNIVIGYHILADDRLMCVGDADPFG